MAEKLNPEQEKAAKEAEERKKAEEAEEKKNQALIAKACKAYGVDEKYLLKGVVRDGAVVLVTLGGSKVRWQEGDKVEPLGPIAVTGVNLENAKRKPIVGKKKAGK